MLITSATADIVQWGEDMGKNWRDESYSRIQGHAPKDVHGGTKSSLHLHWSRATCLVQGVLWSCRSQWKAPVSHVHSWSQVDGGSLDVSWYGLEDVLLAIFTY